MLYRKYSTQKNGLERNIALGFTPRAIFVSCPLFFVLYFPHNTSKAVLKEFPSSSKHGHDACEPHLAAFYNKISQMIKTLWGISRVSRMLLLQNCGTRHHVSNFCLRIVLAEFYIHPRRVLYSQYRTVVTQYRTVAMFAILYGEYTCSIVGYFDLQISPLC